MKRVVIIICLLFLVTSCLNTGRVVDDLSVCEDSDGIDEFNAGEVIFSDSGWNYKFEDECVTTKRVKEVVCKNGAVDFEYISCPGHTRCRFGKCRYAPA